MTDNGERTKLRSHKQVIKADKIKRESCALPDQINLATSFLQKNGMFLKILPIRDGSSHSKVRIFPIRPKRQANVSRGFLYSAEMLFEWDRDDETPKRQCTCDSRRLCIVLRASQPIALFVPGAPVPDISETAPLDQNEAQKDCVYYAVQMANNPNRTFCFSDFAVCRQ